MERTGTSVCIANVLAIVSGEAVSEHGEKLNRALSESAESAVNEILAATPFHKFVHAKLVIHRSFQGSWIIDATLNLWSGIAWAYVALETISKLPEIADGLQKIEDAIKELFRKKVAAISPNAGASVSVVQSSVQGSHVTHHAAVNWQRELSAHLGSDGTIIVLRQADQHLCGKLVSVDAEFIRLRGDREDVIASVAELVAVTFLKDRK